MKEKRVLFCGLFSTGKTSFIAALWYYVTQGRKSANSLVLNSLKNGEHEYLNSIRDNWVSFIKPDRTSSVHLKGEYVQMNLKKVSTDELITLDIPDFSGETFKSHFESRSWTKEYDEILEGSSGITLFMNSTHQNNRPSLIVEAKEIERMLAGNDSLDDSKEGEMSEIKLEEWRHEYVPNQVKLVDFLQFIQYHKPHKLPTKVVIIISAWDKVKKTFGENYKPNNWLKENMPLLWQYTETNSFAFTFRVFGISAQGGDYSDVTSLQELTDLNHLQRIIVVDEDGETNDIAKPILWITE